MFDLQAVRLTRSLHGIWLMVFRCSEDLRKVSFTIRFLEGSRVAPVIYWIRGETANVCARQVRDALSFVFSRPPIHTQKRHIESSDTQLVTWSAAYCTVVTASGCGQWFCVTVTTVGTGMLMIAEDCLRLQRTHGRLCNVVETCISRMSSEGAAAPRYP